MKEEKQSLKKLAKKSESANSANNKKTAAKMTLKKVPKKISTKKLSGGSLKPKAKPGMLRSTCGKKVLNRKKANRSQKVPKNLIQRKGVNKFGVPKKTNNHGANAKLSVGTKLRKVHVSKKKSTGKKVVQNRPKVVSRAAPKRKLTTSRPNVVKKTSARSKISAGKIENVSKPEARKAEKLSEKSEKKADCCCSEKDGEVVQSCWMCRLSQRLGGKLIGNKTKLK